MENGKSLTMSEMQVGQRVQTGISDPRIPSQMLHLWLARADHQPLGCILRALYICHCLYTYYFVQSYLRTQICKEILLAGHSCLCIYILQANKFCEVFISR